MILVTGGMGFIGANFILDWLAATGELVVNIDKLAYAGNIHNLDALKDNAHHVFVHGDIGDRDLLKALFARYRPRAIIHFAAESHVDRSIHAPEDFIQTNVVGTFRLLEETRIYWSALPTAEREHFRFLHISTDEVYGSLEADDPPFTETSPYSPNSPYSASKASANHLVRAYNRTYNLPVIATNCSNNYGPFQFPEKLIPLAILNAVSGKPIPLYGDGLNVRDWLFVSDHCAAIRLVLAHGRTGETYNIGGGCEISNLELVTTICDLLDELTPDRKIPRHADLIRFVEDRPGHDRRYGMDTSKIASELGWTPAETLASGLRKTVAWYLNHMEWIKGVASGDYLKWIDTNYSTRNAL